MELDIRGEMEAAAAELEAAGADFEGDSPDASPASDEPTGETTDSTGDQSASPAIEGDPPAQPDDPPPPDDYELPVGGSIPVPRVRKIVENARAKGKAEAQAQIEALAWAKDVDKETAAEALRIYQFANENPVEYLRQLHERVRANPSLAPQFEALFQSAAPQPPAKTEESDPEPQPDILLEDGRLTYSADQMKKLRAWDLRQVRAQVDGEVGKRLKPIEDARARAAKEEEDNRTVKALMDEAMTWPGMQDAENRKAVAQVVATEGLPLWKAYQKAVLGKLTDTKGIEDRVRKQVIADLKKKPRANSLNPQKTGAESQDFKGKTTREILEATAAELGIE